MALVAAADTPVDAAVGEDVEGRQLLGGADGWQEREHGDGRAQAYAAGASSHVGNRQVNGGVDAIAAEVVFGEPRPVVAEALGLDRLGDLVTEDPDRAPVLGPLHEGKDADIHGFRTRGTACTSEQYVNAVAHQSSWRS